MSTNGPTLETTPDELPRELIDLGKSIASLPVEYQAQLDRAFIEVVEAVRRRRRILNLVQEALAQLRLDIKYLMFDLDVTKRERDQLREQLNDNNS